MAISGNAAASQARDGREVAEAAAAAEARLRALDAMLGGVAHDLNNALSVVLMNLDVMQQDAAVTGKHRRRIDGMLDSMTKASALVRHLLSFSHSRRPEPQVVSVAEILESLLELLQVAVGKDIDVVVESRSDAGPCCVIVDPATFEVGVIHVALQLAAMMPGGGRLVFDLDKIEAENCVVLALAAEPRSPDWSEDGLDKLDLAVIEELARGAHGRVATANADPRAYRLAIHLPASAETTVA